MGFKVSGTVEPVSLVDNYPVIDPLYGIDGLRCVASLSEMYNIPIERRRGGMIVGVQNNISNITDYYKLKPGVTYELGSASNWDPFFDFGTASAFYVKKLIANETLNVPANYQYLVYGDLTIATGGNFVNAGHTIIINGSVNLQGDGTYSIVGSGILDLIPLDQTTKFSGSFSITMSVGYFTVSHNLGTDDIVYTIRDGYNIIYPNVEIIDENRLVIRSIGTISQGRINIIG
jgi:hypothetical protein